MTDTSGSVQTPTEGPRRIQRKRTKGWKMPEGAVYVGRPTVFGNPFRVVRNGRRLSLVDDNGVSYEDMLGQNPRVLAEDCVRMFYEDLVVWMHGRIENQPGLAEAIGGLRGRDLACWCPPDQPCHADVLLEIANA